MRDAVEKIIQYNRSFDKKSLARKVGRLSATPFGFLRGTFHLFAFDITQGSFRKLPTLKASGPIVGDLHTENFGAFRSITNEIVYDINDFDETTTGPYQFDLLRLATGIVIAAHDAGLPLGEGMNAVETMVRSYLRVLERMASVKKRPAFFDAEHTKAIRRLLNVADERSRVVLMKTLAQEREPGKFAFRASDKYIPVTAAQRAEIARALPRYLESCVAPPKAKPALYTFQDAAFRFAGSGSLGRKRFAILLGKGRGQQESLETLRLIEWKDSLESSLDSQQPAAGKRRAEKLVAASLAFQARPKRYLGYVTAFGAPMQAREIGANDCRFDQRQFATLERFRAACDVFGGITARAHLLATLGKTGPRRILREVAGAEDRFVCRLLGFAASYTEQTLADHASFVAREGQVAKSWGVEKALRAGV